MLKRSPVEIVYDSETQNTYETFRIPALVETSDGKLLAFAEGRVESARDDAVTHVLLRTSADLGNSWSELAVVQADGDRTIGNPAPVVDCDTGVIWLFFCKDNREIWLTSSTDNGSTWKEPVNMTQELTRPEHGGFIATGPGHGIQLTHGNRAGRLLVTAYGHQNATATNTAGSKSFSLFSDDHGETWQVGESTQEQAPGLPDGNECMPVELGDGTIYLAIRNNMVNAGRAFARSDDGGTTWDVVQLESSLPAPVCQASILKRNTPDGQTECFYAAPARQATSRKDKSARQKLSLWRSRDDCRHWSKVGVIDRGPSSYSDLAVLNNNELGCLYSAGETKYFGQIRFVRLQIKSSNEDKSQ
ncbi:sialidase family protein [Adhaeretor mobilis]|nr:sialidase family protein [Adhaeretor mobilis]